jgi:hypothetical protein
MYCNVNISQTLPTGTAFVIVAGISRSRRVFGRHSKAYIHVEGLLPPNVGERGTKEFMVGAGMRLTAKSFECPVVADPFSQGVCVLSSSNGIL